MTLDPVELKSRLTRKPDFLELLALTITVIFAVWTIWMHTQNPISGLLDDYTIFTNASQGNYHGYYYGLWGIPIFYPFSLLPFSLGVLAWQLLNIAGMFFAARVFAGRSAVLLFSYQMFVTLYFGQISGILCLGMAIMWLGLSKRNWLLAGLGLSVAAVKPQVAVLAGFIWLYAFLSTFKDATQKKRIYWMLLIVPLAAIAVSFLVQPNWVLQTLERIKTTPPEATASITDWDYIGAWGLLLLIPPLILPLNRRARLLAMMAAWLVAAPYFQPWDIAPLWMLLPNWLPLLSWVAVPLGYPQPALPLFSLLLLTAFYLWQILPGIFSVLGLHPVWFDRLRKLEFPKPQQLKGD